ncbi:MAG: ATP-binding protein [Planctomycetota bacterium]
MSHFSSRIGKRWKEVIERCTESLSLRTRISLGCGVQMILCVVCCAMGLIGQYRLTTLFESHEKIGFVAESVAAIDKDVHQLKLASESYIHTGAKTKRKAAVKLANEIADRTKEIERQVNSETKELLVQMSRHVAEFSLQLDRASREREIREELVHSVIPDRVASLQRTIKVHVNPRDTGSSDSFKRVLALALLHRGESLLHRYLLKPRNAIREEYLLVADELLSVFDQAGQTNLADTELVRMRVAAVEIRRLAMHAMQATRGFMYYENVVMAGQISEFSYYAKRLQDTMRAKLERNRINQVMASSQTFLTTTLSCALACILALIVSSRLYSSIVNPISELTSSFRKLADGQSLETIPGTSRNDEIGKMSAAAQVFSEKNLETEQLLSRQKQLASELDAKASSLEEINSELDNFAYVASHDLKAPLRGIRNLASWVREDSKDDISNESRRHLLLMESRVDKMESLLTDLLEYSRIGKLDQASETVDIQSLLDATVEMLDVPDGLRIRVFGNNLVVESAATPLRQVVLNLLTNAVKYNDKGADGRITVRCTEQDKFIRVSVSDNGPGIDTKHYARVFQMYQRLATQGVEGSGMGLAMVKKHVEQRGGSIELDSKVGQGATFTFTWPKHVGLVKEEPASLSQRGEQPREFALA